MLNKCRRQRYSKETNLHSKEKNNYFLLYKQRVCVLILGFTCFKKFFGNFEYNYWSSVTKYLFCSNHWLSKSNLRHHGGVEI